MYVYNVCMYAWCFRQRQCAEQASGLHLDLIRTLYALYGVKYIDLVAPLVKLYELMRRRAGLQASGPYLDLGRAPYALYVLFGVTHINPVSHRCAGQECVGARPQAVGHCAAGHGPHLQRRSLPRYLFQY